MKMSRLTNTSHVIMKSEILIKTTPWSITSEDDNISLLRTLIAKPKIVFNVDPPFDHSYSSARNANVVQLYSGLKNSCF